MAISAPRGQKALALHCQCGQDIVMLEEGHHQEETQEDLAGQAIAYGSVFGLAHEEDSECSCQRDIGIC